MNELLEQLCEEMHDRYEKAATGAGWETNPESRKPWSGVPEANKATMRAAIGPIADRIAELEAEASVQSEFLIAERKARKQVDAADSRNRKHITEQQATIERLECKRKEDCCAFYYWWWNQEGTNTSQGYDEWKALADKPGEGDGDG